MDVTEPREFGQLAGKTRSRAVTVDGSMTASAVGSGGVEVFSTPSMILLFEQVARDAVQEHLPQGYTTVGTKVDVKHLSAVPVGEKVTISAIVDSVEGRKLIFRVEASDRLGPVGKGTHERLIVHLAKFMEKVSGKYGG